MRSRHALFGLAVCFWLLPALAADEEAPDMDFLLYLGSWEDSDETWTLFDDSGIETTANVDDASEVEATKDEDDES